MMPKPRPQLSRDWTWDDHLDNEQRLQREADRRTWDRLGRCLGLRGRELQALLARFMDDRIASALHAHQPPLLDQLKAPADAAALRDALGDLLCDDIAAMVQILTSKGSTDDTGDAQEASRRGEPDAADNEREVHEDVDEGDKC